MDLLHNMQPAFHPAWYILSPIVLIAIILSSVRLYTTWDYYRALRTFIESPKGGKIYVQAPQIPYTFPWLANSLSFLVPQPGAYWNQLFSWHPRSTGICTLILGGVKTNILLCPAAVQALFKARSPTREQFELELFTKVFQLSEEQTRKAYAGKHMEHEMNAKYLTRPERVNELTGHFTRVLEEVLSRDAEHIQDLSEIGLYEWLRDRMFTASMTALMGDEILKMYPNFCEEFFAFDRDFLSFFFGVPKLMLGEAIARRKRIIEKLQAWSAEMHQQSGGSPVDPEGPVWEPLFGSRLNRARHIDYKNRGLNARSSASLDLGLIFGLQSNVIPATCWMLMHLLNPAEDPSLLSRVMVEIQQAERPDGSLDIPLLVNQSLLQSIWNETLRVYTDVIVTRSLPEDLTIPLDEDSKHLVTLHKGENVFAISWLGGHDAAAWSGGNSEEIFDAERFIIKDSETGKDTFSMSGTSGKLFPFGGGRTICPGRVFAKQEALGALAFILLRFDFEVKGFTDADKKPTTSFPKIARAFAGSGTLAPGGDIRVKISPRS